MEKSNDYDKIHNEVVHSEQVGEVLLCRSRNRFSWPRKNVLTPSTPLFTGECVTDVAHSFSCLMCYFQ